MKTKPSNIWFPAKSYGWGWSFPCAWQGWVVLLAYVGLLGAAGLLIDPAVHMKLWLVAVWGLTAILIPVCWWKGEKPAWRWGDKK